MKDSGVGKIILDRLDNVTIADVEYDDGVKKCVCIPIEDNNIVRYKNQWQLWYRRFPYRQPTGKFTHFLMKFIAKKDIARMSHEQLEKFSIYAIGEEKSLKKQEQEVNN